MMSNQLIFIILVGGVGVFCLVFANTAARFLSLFTQVSGKIQGTDISPEESWARPTFIRLMGLAQIGMAVLVYFGKLNV